MNVAGPKDPPSSTFLYPCALQGSKPRKKSPGKTLDPMTRPGTSVAALRGPRLALESQTWTVEPRCQSSRKPGALQCRRPDCGTQVAGGSAAGALGEQREINVETYAGCRGAAASPLRCHPPGALLRPSSSRGSRRLREVAAQGGGRRERPDAGGEVRMEDGPVGDPAARLGPRGLPAPCTAAAVAPATPRPKSQPEVTLSKESTQEATRVLPAGFFERLCLQSFAFAGARQSAFAKILRKASCVNEPAKGLLWGPISF